MKNLIMSLLFLTLIGCTDSNTSKYYENHLLFGNWYSIKNDSYLEYYIDSSYIYTYTPYSNDIIKYRYKIQKDSIFRSISDYQSHVLLSDYSYFSRILKIDLTGIALETRFLNKLSSKNSLEELIKIKIDKKTLETESIRREKRFNNRN